MNFTEDKTLNMCPENFFKKKKLKASIAKKFENLIKRVSNTKNFLIKFLVNITVCWKLNF
jgi:hypothetical protein